MVGPPTTRPARTRSHQRAVTRRVPDLLARRGGQTQPGATDPRDLRDRRSALHHSLPGTKRLDRLQVRELQTWINTVARTCQCCVQDKDANRPETKRRCCALGQCCHSTPSPRTLNDIRGCLRAALSHAIAEDLISKNPRRGHQGVVCPATHSQGAGLVQRGSSPISGISPSR